MESFTSKEEPIKTDVHRSTIIDTLLQEKESKSNEINSSLKQTINDLNTLPIYILPPLYTTIEKPSTLRIDTTNNPSNDKWDSSFHQYSDLSTSSSPSSYTSKIRHRHYSVGSYYDNKTTTVALHPNHTLYLIGSAPVSPISRTSTTSSESHYHIHHHSPVSYVNVKLNALRRVNPFLETNAFISNYEYQQSASLNRDEHYQTIPQNEPATVIPQSISSQSSTQSSSITFPQYEPPKILPKTISTSPPVPPRLEQEPIPLVRPKTSRGRPHTPPPLPPRIPSIEKDQTQNIYQEFENLSTDDDQPITTRNADLQFIRGTIERVFDFHGESTSESSTTYYEGISEDNKNENESISLSNSSKRTSKKDNQYPAVEAVQRFYHTKSPSHSEKKISIEQTTNLDDIPLSNHSSGSNKLYPRSNPANIQKLNLSKSLSKSSDNEQASSEEIDDTLNDIEDDDYQDEKLKRQHTNNSSHTSNENSPTHSLDNQINIKKTSQETQTLKQVCLFKKIYKNLFVCFISSKHQLL